MIQDIFPSRFDNQYRPIAPENGDFLLHYDKEGKVFVQIKEGRILFTKAEDGPIHRPVYLFTIDEQKYFLETEDEPQSREGYTYLAVRDIRDEGMGTEVFAAFTAFHLWKWYADNRYCGKCGKPFGFHPKERALCCPDCGNILYPRINPAVIVGVINGEYLLLTRYRRGYGHNALVAGFTEIGETLEETVAREVMEETGLKVKNIQYYKSQPWGMAQDILAGFYCEADGDTQIHMDENELKYAQWVKREEIELQPNNLSLTNEMMRMFKEGKR